MKNKKQPRTAESPVMRGFFTINGTLFRILAKRKRAAGEKTPTALCYRLYSLTKINQMKS